MEDSSRVRHPAVVKGEAPSYYLSMTDIRETLCGSSTTASSMKENANQNWPGANGRAVVQAATRRGGHSAPNDSAVAVSSLAGAPET